MKIFRNLTVSLAVLAACSLAGCKEDTLKVYHGDNYLHFTPLADRSVQRSELNFATYKSTGEREGRVPVSLTLWGYLPEDDFRYRVSVVAEGSDATEADFDAPDFGTFHAGEAVDTLWIKVRRQEELLKTRFGVTLRLEDAGPCVIGPRAYETVRVEVTDRIAEPAWWNQAYAIRLGAYSDIKYRVFNIYLGRVLTSLEGYTAISLGEEITRFKAWWKERWQAGEYRYYDADGTTPLYETIADAL